MPCPYSWDVGNGLHMHGKQHHAGCLTKSGTDEATCNRIAHHVAAHCTWDHASRGSHIIHYKGKNKPWKHLKERCRPAMLGQLIVAMPGGGGDGFGGSSAYHSAAHRRLVAGADQLLFGAGACRLRTSLGDLGVGPIVTWANGEAVNATCCDEWTLLRAEWWHVARLTKHAFAADAVTPSALADESVAPTRPSGPCLNSTELLCRNGSGVRASTALGGVVCVAASCGTPEGGSMQACSSRPGGRGLCCAGFIQRHGSPCCTASETGCVLKEATAA